jgi:hypothetical protein
LAKALPFRTAISNLSYHAKVLVKCQIAKSGPDLAEDSSCDVMYRTLVGSDAAIRNVLDQMRGPDAALSDPFSGPEELP